MRRKMFTLITTLKVLIATASPTKVKAQSLVILAVVGIGLDQKAEIYFAPRPTKGTPGKTATFTILVTNPDDATCTQTIEKVVLQQTIYGLPMLAVSKGFDFIAYEDGSKIELEDPCFKNPQSQRGVFQVGVKVPPEMEERLASEPDTILAEVMNLAVLGYSIANPDGSTATSASAPLRDSPLIVTRNAEF